MNYVGIDTGGTFTDIVVANDQGQLRTYKTDSTPGDLAVGVVEGLRLAAAMRPAHLSQITGGQRLLPMGGVYGGGGCRQSHSPAV